MSGTWVRVWAKKRIQEGLRRRCLALKTEDELRRLSQADQRPVLAESDWWVLARGLSEMFLLWMSSRCMTFGSLFVKGDVLGSSLFVKRYGLGLHCSSRVIDVLGSSLFVKRYGLRRSSRVMFWRELSEMFVLWMSSWWGRFVTLCQGRSSTLPKRLFTVCVLYYY